MSEKTRRSPKNTRRAFIKAGAGAAAVAWSGALHAAGANEKVTVGLIGCGKRSHQFFDDVDFVCDPDETRLAMVADRANVPTSNAVTDMRRILDNPAIDAVVIATPDHWHAPAAILACEAGKHIYIEKPCSHNIRETRLLIDAAERNNVIVQHGTQQRSMPYTRDAIQMLHDGVIGDVLVAKAWNIQRRRDIGHLQPSDPPANVDYDLWVGPAEWMPFQKNRFHYDWHWWYNFGTGDFGGDGMHELDYARWGLGVDTLPTRVTGLGGKYYFDDDQQFPDTATCAYEYPGDGKTGSLRQLIFEMRIWSTNYPYNCDSGVEFYGTEGQMFFSKRGKLQILGPKNEKIKSEKFEKSEIEEHWADFIDAIRSGRPPNANLDEAHRSVALIHLGNIAVRLGRSLELDVANEQIMNDAQANAMLGRTYRDGGHWAVPKGVT